MVPETIIYNSIKGLALIAKAAMCYQNAKDINNSIKQELEKMRIINESINGFLCLIRSDIQTMMHMYFLGAYENLHYALNATYDNKKEYLIRARDRFIDASTIERNENLILTYIGLAFCQELLNDSINSETSLKRINLVDWADVYSDNSGILLKDWDPNWIQKLIFLNYTRFTNPIPFSNSTLIPLSVIGYASIFQEALSGDYNKDIYRQRLNALIKCDGFSKVLDKKAFYDNCVKAEKLILKETFSSFKQQVISSFNIN